MSEPLNQEKVSQYWQGLLGRLKLLLPLIFIGYVGLALYLSWMTGGKGGPIKTDPAIEARMRELNCSSELKKHVVPLSRKDPNPWLLQTKQEGGLYLEALKEKPECSALIMMLLLPSRTQVGSDYVTYYYDKATDRRMIKVTVEYLH